MRKLILLCGLLVTGLCFAAKPSSTNEWQKEVQRCEGGAEIAETIMAARQRGVSIREIYKILASLDEGNRAIFEIFVNSAYSVPMVPTEEEAKMVVLDFSDQFFKACMENK